MEPSIARRMHLPVESIHTVVYFAEEAQAIYTGIGLKPGGMSYFAPRAAPMGAVPPEVVASTFYNFSPGPIHRAFPLAWERVSPERTVTARLELVDVSLRRLLGDDVVEGGEVTEAAGLARSAAEACPVDGRPLFAGHASLPWPDAPHLALWHAISLVREFRGDGHVAALVAAGINGIDALLTYAATDAASPNMLPSRGWQPEELDAARGRLRERGWLDTGGALTDAGRAARQEVEDRTDVLAIAPWRALGAAGCDRLHELLVPLASAITSGQSH
ncbi:MAG: hypothetical protein JF603_00460 [Acidobacteria bacterium]|nr:hypothetical protein [Acidobacteriota bacterium]